MNWRRDGLVLWKPVHALLFTDQKVFFWIKEKFGLSEYQMAALVWLKGLFLACSWGVGCCNQRAVAKPLHIG